MGDLFQMQLGVLGSPWISSFRDPQYLPLSPTLHVRGASSHSGKGKVEACAKPLALVGNTGDTSFAESKPGILMKTS